MTTTNASPRRPRSRVLGVCAAIGVAALAFAPLAACATGSTGTPDARTSTNPSAPASGGLGALDGAPGGGPAGQPNPAGQPSASTTRSRAASPKPTAQIVSFTVTRQPACPVVGTPDAPFSAPGQDIAIEWKVTGATRVALSVDKGLYQTYDGIHGTATISFPCDTNQPMTTHTYTINTLGGGTSRSKTLTVTKQSNP
jgi:hypothetical protein